MKSYTYIVLYHFPLCLKSQIQISKLGLSIVEHCSSKEHSILKII